ncbi:MAG TPA: peptidyl-prolyl cis-trans isomerase [Gammaproteobacteria bacterium]|nr:peptidyl-prolyl cis-trans isomerase [Gammaproteobacteria bacterium]
MKNWLLLLCLLLLSVPALAADNPRVKFTTSEGEFVVELYPDKAPATVTNFLKYVDDSYYDSTIFHRVIRNFMIQGGGFTPDFRRKPTRAPILNEADNGLKNERGTIAMARTFEPHSATAQFFINVRDNPNLDHSSPTPRGWGYAVFGRVVEGMDVVDRIRDIPTGSAGPFPSDVPRKMVTIISVTRLAPTPKPAPKPAPAT